ncbi:putative protein OS=Streptomyces violarus OX=67380 GN=FHS41_007729 PE=4 SV=1 [Streptomyces violarus]
MRLIRKSTLRKYGVVAATAALAVSGLLAGAGTATAGPAGATNIRGVDRGTPTG